MSFDIERTHYMGRGFTIEGVKPSVIPLLNLSVCICLKSWIFERKKKKEIAVSIQLIIHDRMEFIISMGYVIDRRWGRFFLFYSKF